MFLGLPPRPHRPSYKVRFKQRQVWPNPSLKLCQGTSPIRPGSGLPCAPLAPHAPKHRMQTGALLKRPVLTQTHHWVTGPV